MLFILLLLFFCIAASLRVMDNACGCTASVNFASETHNISTTITTESGQTFTTDTADPLGPLFGETVFFYGPDKHINGHIMVYNYRIECKIPCKITNITVEGAAFWRINKNTFDTITLAAVNSQGQSTILGSIVITDYDTYGINAFASYSMDINTNDFATNFQLWETNGDGWWRCRTLIKLGTIAANISSESPTSTAENELNIETTEVIQTTYIQGQTVTNSTIIGVSQNDVPDTKKDMIFVYIIIVLICVCCIGLMLFVISNTIRKKKSKQDAEIRNDNENENNAIDNVDMDDDVHVSSVESDVKENFIAENMKNKAIIEIDEENMDKLYIDGGVILKSKNSEVEVKINFKSNVNVDASSTIVSSTDNRYSKTNSTSYEHLSSQSHQLYM